MKKKNQERPLSLAERWAMDDNIFFIREDGTEKEVKLKTGKKTETKKAATYDELREAERNGEEEERELTPADYDRWETPPGAIY